MGVIDIARASGFSVAPNIMFQRQSIYDPDIVAVCIADFYFSAVAVIGGKRPINVENYISVISIGGVK